MKCKKCGDNRWSYCYYLETATCKMCWEERPYTPRKRGEYMTESQKKALAKIDRHFNARLREKYGEDSEEYRKLSYTIQSEMIDGGICYVRAKDIRWDGAVFMIGRRGAIKVYDSYRTCSKQSKAHKKHLAKMLGGTVQ